MLPVRAYGHSGQPTKQRALLEAFHSNTNAYLLQRHWEVQQMMVVVRSTRDLAASAGAPEVFVADADDELQKLSQRLRIYWEMQLVLQAGGMKATADELNSGRGLDDPWNMDKEMEAVRRARGGGALTIQPPPIQIQPVQRRSPAAARQSRHPAARIGRSTAAAVQSAARSLGRTTMTAARAASAQTARALRAAAREARRQE